jgi:hypothetical protein
MTAQQLALALTLRPGYCACGKRLSVMDTDGTCMFCREDPPPGRRCRCGQPSVGWVGNNDCRKCRNAASARARAVRKTAAASAAGELRA